MPNTLLTIQEAGKLFAEEINAVLYGEGTLEVLEAARKCGEECAKLVGCMDARDPRATLRSHDASQK